MVTRTALLASVPVRPVPPTNTLTLTAPGLTPSVCVCVCVYLQPRYRLPGVLVAGGVVGYTVVLVAVRELDAYMVRKHGVASG